MAFINVSIGENDVVVALIHAAFGLMTERVERFAKPRLAFFALENHGQLNGVEALIAYVAQYVELRIGQYGVRQAHHLAVAFIRIEDAGTHSADVFGETHHQILTYGVDGGVGYLGKLLPEVVEEYLRFVAQNGQRRVVTHGCCRLLALGRHGYDGVVDVFFAKSELYLLAYEVVYIVSHLPARLEFLKLNAVGREPLTVRMCSGKALFYLSVIVYLAFLGVYQQYFSGLQTSLFGYFRGVEVHYSHLRSHHHGVVLGDSVARRTQSVAVEHTSCEASVAKEQCGGSIPGLHEYGVILVEGLQILGYRVLVVEAFGYHHGHGMRQ